MLPLSEEEIPLKVKAEFDSMFSDELYSGKDFRVTLPVNKTIKL